mmetsp:Transcript_54043/g.156038  ORF Transcript_54043/g.156038 Transcript_54043/m.156038 type:complete len:250 (-) Transcript_54043:66-815(-)
MAELRCESLQAVQLCGAEQQHHIHEVRGAVDRGQRVGRLRCGRESLHHLRRGAEGHPGDRAVLRHPGHRRQPQDRVHVQDQRHGDVDLLARGRLPRVRDGPQLDGRELRGHTLGGEVRGSWHQRVVVFVPAVPLRPLGLVPAALPPPRQRHLQRRRPRLGRVWRLHEVLFLAPGGEVHGPRPHDCAAAGLLEEPVLPSSRLLPARQQRSARSWSCLRWRRRSASRHAAGLLDQLGRLLLAPGGDAAPVR